jgi:hypothetical protein
MIPCYKPVGKNLFFDKAEIDVWLRRNPVSTAMQMECKATNHTTLNPVK